MPHNTPLLTCAFLAASRCSFRSFFRLSMMRFCSISWSSNPARSLHPPKTTTAAYSRRGLGQAAWAGEAGLAAAPP